MCWLEAGLFSVASILLQPLDALANLPVNISSPTVPSFVGLQLDLGAVIRQAALGLLCHTVGADTIVRRMAEVIGTAFRCFQRRRQLSFFLNFSLALGEVAAVFAIDHERYAVHFPLKSGHRKSCQFLQSFCHFFAAIMGIV